MTSTNSLYKNYLKALNYPGSPTLFLDLHQFEKNLKWVKDNAGNKKIRIATKSVRSKDIFKKILESDSIFQGLMTYDLREALWLRKEGFNDILMGYPTVDLMALKELAQSPDGIVLMVDRPEHLELLNSLAQEYNQKFLICLDIDLSMDLPGVRFGVYRSFVNSEERLKTFLNVLNTCTHLELKGLMGYEAQIAGVMDKESALIRLLKKISLNKLQKRRESFLKIIQSYGKKPTLINGGGTGSLQDTRQEECVTEVTVGSGFFSPVLFDHYQNFKLSPALCFTLPIVRHPEDHIWTCLGGGYIASGATESIKQPTPYLPSGLKLLKHEGAGEVQTPLTYSGSLSLKIGDSIIMRHAKAGEVCERFEEIRLISGEEEVGRVKTYRGEGKTFV